QSVWVSAAPAAMAAFVYPAAMTEYRTDIEAFMQGIVREVEAAEAAGIATPAALAAHFNAKGLTTRKGRGWTAETMRKFLSSPGARRLRKSGATGGPDGAPPARNNRKITPAGNGNS
ncbi:MAG: recombinase-like helix-turn-helix domain-containing protein, partial [Rhodospirillaceae bacterium]